MARPRKPTSLKVVAGTDRPDRQAPAAAELPIVDALPEPPLWMSNSHAQLEYQRLGPILIANGLLSEAGLMTFVHYCNLHGQLARLWAASMEPTGHLLSQYRGLANDFGLTPVAQGKVKPSGETQKPASKFGGIGQRPPAKR